MKVRKHINTLVFLHMHVYVCTSMQALDKSIHKFSSCRALKYQGVDTYKSRTKILKSELDYLYILEKETLKM